MIQINQKVKDFKFTVFHNNEEKTIKVSQFKNKWLVLIFYPGDFTFICPTELEEAAQYYSQFKKLGAEIISVSTDSVLVHKAWHDTSPAIKQVKFPMAADPTGVICREFGTYIEDEGKSLRGTFIIDPDGILKTIQINDNDIGRSVKELLRTFEAAKFVRENPGKVCPASWEPGQEPLKPGMDLVGKI